MYAALIEEKAMMQRFAWLKTRHFGNLLQNAGLGLALIVLTAPARAESVTLSCRNGDGPETITLRINYATRLVEQIGPSGQAYTNRTAPDARISDNAIVWSVTLMDTGLANPVPMIWEGTIDRLSGTGWTRWSREPYMNHYRENLTCGVATKPKF
jgi:hypothetical protein